MAKDDHSAVERVDPTRGLVRHERRVAVRARFREAEDPVGWDQSWVFFFVCCLLPRGVCQLDQRRGDCWLGGARTFRGQALDQLAQDAALDALGVRERDQDVDVVRIFSAAAVAAERRRVRTPEPD